MATPPIESVSGHRTPAQIEQEAEGNGRNRAILDDAGNELGPDQRQSTIDDATGEGDAPARRVPPEPGDEGERQPQKVFKGSPSDQKRMEIAKRFRRNADGEPDTPYNGDPNDPEMQYGKVARVQLEPEAGDSVVGSKVGDEPIEQAAALDETQMVTRTVRGKPVTKTMGEWLDDAAKVSAADSYLDEGRRLLEDARTMKNSAQRTGQDSHHPEDRTGAQDDDLNPDANQDRQHPDELEAAIEEIQFGDPKKAAGKIREVIAKATDESADKRQRDRLINNDLATAQADLKAFMVANPDLAKDKIANVAMEEYMYDIYREDITKLGVDPSEIPTETNELANWHRFYRIDGRAVRKTAEALQEAKARFEKWKGVAPKQPAAPARSQPRVEVNVDRDQRRQNIQSQPSRAVAPRPDAVRQAPARKSRHEIIMDMRRARGRPVA